MIDDNNDNAEVLPSEENPPIMSQKGKRKKNWSGVEKAKRESQATKHATILKMRLEGNTVAVISEAVSMPIGTVKSIIHRFKPVFQEIENVNDFRSVKSDILDAGQLAALKSAFTGRKLAKSSFLATISAAEKLQKMQRLHDGQSTENVAHAHFGSTDIDE